MGFASYSLLFDPICRCYSLLILYPRAIPLPPCVWHPWSCSQLFIHLHHLVVSADWYMNSFWLFNCRACLLHPILSMLTATLHCTIILGYGYYVPIFPPYPYPCPPLSLSNSSSPVSLFSPIQSFYFTPPSFSPSLVAPPPLSTSVHPSYPWSFAGFSPSISRSGVTSE